MSLKLAEYFELKGKIKLLREDRKDLMDQHELAEEIEELKKQLKELREMVKEDESIDKIGEKIKTLKERQDLLKEIVLAEMKEGNQEKIEFEGNEIKVVENLKIKRIKT